MTAAHVQAFCNPVQCNRRFPASQDLQETDAILGGCYESSCIRLEWIELCSMTGTNALLDQLLPFIPDQFLSEQWPHTGTGGRCGHFSAAQLWRVHLLVLLTPAHSVNLLVQMLSEQRAWREFAHLPNRRHVPDVLMLHEFRQRVGVAGLRRVNEVLLAPLLDGLDPSAPAIALMDATDLPAACHSFVGYKKHTFRLWLSAHTEHVLLVPLVTWIGPCQRRGRWSVVAGGEIMRGTFWLATGLRDRGHGLLGGGAQADLPNTLASGCVTDL